MTDNTFNPSQVNTPKGAEHLNTAFAAVTAFLCCLALPFTSFTAVAIAIAAIASGFAAMVSRKRPVTMVILVASLYFASVSGYLAFASFVAAAAVGCGALAWLITNTRSPLTAIIPSLAYAISTVITRDWFLSLSTLLFVLPSVILAYTYSKMNSRVSTLLKTAVGYAVFLILAIFFTVLRVNGTFDFRIITDFLNAYRDGLVEALASIEIPTSSGSLQPLMSETEAFNYVSQLISLLPAIFTGFCGVMAYLSQKVQFSTVICNEGEAEFSDLRRVFIMSPVSAAVFVISFLVYTITAASSASAVAATVCSNLYLIFLPGLSLMGAKLFLERRHHAQKRGCSPFLVVGLIVFSVFLSPGLLLVMAACYGAYSAIETPLRKYFANKKNS